MLSAYRCECHGCKQLMQYDTITGARRFKAFHEAGCQSVVEIWNIRDKIYSDVPVVSEVD